MKTFQGKILLGCALFFLSASVRSQPSLTPAANRIDADPAYSKIYWSNLANNSIDRMNLDGTGRQTIVNNASSSGQSFALEIDIPHQKIYWYNEGANSIQRQNFDGTGRETVVTNSGFTYMMILDIPASKIYWANYEGKSLQRSNFDGTGKQTLVSGIGSGPEGPVAFELDFVNSKVYWYDPMSLTIRRANLNGTSPENFLTGIPYLYSLVIDKANQKLYFSNYTAKSIERINLNGTSRETVVTGATTGTNPNQGPIAIAVDNVNSKIYWYDEAIDAIRRSNLNNTAKETYISSSGYTYSIVFPVEDAISLPLNLEAFNVRQLPDGVSVDWKTSREINTASFEIQRATNNGDFIPVATISANQKGGIYAYHDTKISAGSIYMYRLKMLDIDGAFQYSRIVTINTAFKPEADRFSIFNYPGSGSYIYLKRFQEQKENIGVAVSDVNGRVVYNGILQNLNGVYTIPAGNIRPGCYVVRILDAKNSLLQVSMFIK